MGRPAQKFAEVFAWCLRPGLFAFWNGTTNCLGLFVITLEIQLQKGLHGFTLRCYFDAIQEGLYIEISKTCIGYHADEKAAGQDGMTGAMLAGCQFTGLPAVERVYESRWLVGQVVCLLVGGSG